ncbi:iron-containing alcohol dehydrogenase [Rhizobium cauense]|uniref:iron-containing alcohol dehydrogenase n=1 Tax=Rhizobium cauense TaxID=1166683 RepID=UPI001C6E91B6|nr:iron-containing alcohol dehydrogenase [Rhizobium cauense]MBW9113905.1 iron-containing alcohol dehydrogenase [Rhizobium cauense]
MQQLDFLPQEKVIWGRQVLTSALAKLNHYGIERPILFTVEPLAGLANEIAAAIGPDVVGEYLEFPPHVPETAVNNALRACESTGAKSIIALGGGSVLDAAKAVSHFNQRRHGLHLPIVALPTTLSGSEFSHYFGVTETAGAVKFKRSYAVKETAPRVVVIDPELIRGTPRGLLLSSAIKGIDHAVEGMRLVEPDHPHAVLAASGVARFLGVLNRWPSGGETQNALEAGSIALEDLLQLQLAAWQCYFFPASVVYGLSHRIGHILGGTFGVPHSLTSCITLAPVIEACAPFYGEKLRVFNGRASGREAASVLSRDIGGVVSLLGLPSKLREVGFERKMLSQVAELLVENYPREVEDLGIDAHAKLAALLESLW